MCVDDVMYVVVCLDEFIVEFVCVSCLFPESILDTIVPKLGRTKHIWRG